MNEKVPPLALIVGDEGPLWPPLPGPFPEHADGSHLVTVCGAVELFSQVTVSPAFTASDDGLKQNTEVPQLGVPSMATVYEATHQLTSRCCVRPADRCRSGRDGCRCRAGDSRGRGCDDRILVQHVAVYGAVVPVLARAGEVNEKDLRWH